MTDYKSWQTIIP